MALRATEQDRVLTVEVIVQPRASRAALGPVREGRLRVAVTAAPVNGEANLAVVRQLAEALNISRSAIEIVGGQSGRRKTVRLAGVSLAEFLEVAGR